MSGLSKRAKVAIAAGAVIVLTAAASSASTQHHPFSELFPPDQDLDFGGQDIQNVSQLETGIVTPNQSDIVFRDSGDVEVLRWNYSSNQWDFQNSDVHLNGNYIEEVDDIVFNGGSNTNSGLIIPQSGNGMLGVYNDTGGSTPIMEWESTGTVEVPSGNIDTKGNNITSSGGEMCIGEYC